MVVLRLHFQITGHKQPILAVGAHGDILVTAENGVIRLWYFGSSHAASGGPALLKTVSCSRQPIRALFITPGGLHVVGVFEQDGVVLFGVKSGLTEQHVLLQPGEEKGARILAAAWNADTCSLAMATAAGGVKIYELSPAPCEDTFGVIRREGSCDANAVRPTPATLTLRHDIVVKSISSTPNGGRKASLRHVGSLATDDSSEDGKAGAGILVGIADGQHLCVWDLVTGSTLLTALAIAPAGCKVEKVVWHRSTALAALLYSAEGGLRRVDVHQIDVARQATTPLLSYISDVLIAGVNFSAAPDVETPVQPTTSSPSTPHRATSRVYLHVVDRLRTLRTWLLHPGGANAVASYSLPAAAPRVPIVPSKVVSGAHANAIGPESQGGSPCDGESNNEFDSMVVGDAGAEGREAKENGGRNHRRRPNPSVEAPTDEEEEEQVDIRSLASGALVAVVISGRLRGNAGPGILVVAGVALSGVSFLPEGGALPQRQGDESPIWEDSGLADALDGSGREGGVVPRVLGMRGLMSENGAQQALALVWAERPSFQVLDVSCAGRAGLVQKVPLARRHREDQVATAPRSDRPCFLTSWSHSTTLGTLLAGWNDGAVDVIKPCVARRRSRLLPPGGTCVPVTALGIIPQYLLFQHTGNQFQSDPGGVFCEGDGVGSAGGRGGVAALVGSADGTLALWPTGCASRPWNTILAHTDAVVAVRTAMDAPHDARGWTTAASVTFKSTTDGGGSSGDGRRRAKQINDRARDAGGHNATVNSGNSFFFVLTAGANREVKVWGIDAASRQGVPLLVLRGYTVVGGGARGDDQLTVLELLSEGFMACGLNSGTVEVWPIPLTSRCGVVATARKAVQAFPFVHGTKVTSITVSFGLRFRAGCGGSVTAGRVVLTTSADHTVVRWVSMAPGDNIKPLSRYCLSMEPTAAVLLPPSIKFAGELAAFHPETTHGRVDLEPASKAIPIFRVASSLSGVITVLELATEATLLGEENTTRRVDAAVANAFPGTPLVPRLPLWAPADGSDNEETRGGIRWRVGGPKGREAGRYNVLSGTKRLPMEWEASGSRRSVVAAALQKAWYAIAPMYGGEGTGKVAKQLKQSDGQGELHRSSSEHELKYQSKLERGKRPVSNETTRGGMLFNRRPEPRVTTLTVTPGGDFGTSNDIVHDRGSDQEFGQARKNMYRHVSGGKTIKLDPEFATAVLERSWPDQSSDGTPRISQPGSAQNTGINSIDLMMPSCTHSHHHGNVSSILPRNMHETSTVSVGGIAITTSHVDGDDFQSVNSAVLGWPPSYGSPSHADINTRSSLGTSEQQQRSPRTASDTATSVGEATSAGATSVDATPSVAIKTTGDGVSISAAKEGSLNGSNQEGVDKAGSVNSDATATGVARVAVGYKTTSATAMNVSVAAATAARKAREAWNARGRLATPVVIGRQEGEKAQRQQFHFDSAQAPSSGMLGVGVAVPTGYADARLTASKRSFTPAASLRKTTRRRFNESKKHDLPLQANDVVSPALETILERESDKVKTKLVAETFPTGLVVSKHFLETSSGRQILMLEITKTARPRTVSAGSSRGQLRPSSDLGRAGDGTTAGSAVGTEHDAAAAAAAAATMELDALSPRSRALHEMFELLSAGRETVTQEALAKWCYVSRSIERGLVSQYQVKSLFRQAHGGRHRSKMVWRDMIAFYEGMEAALDKACTPPLTEEFVVDGVEWDSILVSVYLTKRGDIYVVAVEAGSGDGPPVSPATVRSGGDSGSDARVGGSTRVISAWATATIVNPDVPARLTLTGLSPERDYELYAYAENGGGRQGSGGDGPDYTKIFSVEPAPSGMSSALVAATRLAARTAREPDEELDVPWEDLSESERMAEALAALSDPVVARAAREAALDVPTAGDLTRCEADPVSRNKWRSFCRWWAGGGRETERAEFLLRECVFAAQQPEVLEEAARMGVQLLEGDWNAAADGDTVSATPSSPTILSGRQRRWTAFRSWYRGGRVFDRAHKTLIAAAMLRRPPSPGSQGRPLTPHIAPADRPQPAPPITEETPTEEEEENVPAGSSKEISEVGEAMAVPLTAAVAVSDVTTTAAEPVIPVVGVHRRTRPPALPPPPKVTLHVTKLKTDEIVRRPGTASGGGHGSKDDTLAKDGSGTGGNDGLEVVGAVLGVLQGEGTECVSEIASLPTERRDPFVDAARVDGIAGWGEERAEQAESGRKENGGYIAEGLPPLSHEGGTTAAKRLRMEARRKFLAARTTVSKEAASKVGKLLDVKREDVKAKRTAAAASGVVARRGRAAAAAAEKQRRRSQVERALALKRADELLEKSGKAEDIRTRRGSLGTLRPEDVASIGVFDSFNVEEFDPEEADPSLFARRASASGETDHMDEFAREAAMWAPRSPEELTLELQLACVHPRVCIIAASAGIGVPDPEDALSPLSHKKARWAIFSAWYYPPDKAFIVPQRKVLLGAEVSAAMGDEIVRFGMHEEGLDSDEHCDESDFLDWYCEGEAAPRQEFRRRRVEELLQARRLVATQVLAYMPTPFLFQEHPPLIPPPLPATVARFCLFPSRSPEAFSWEDVSKWYDVDVLSDDDDALRAGERAGQRAALLDAARAEEGNSQALERRVARWEDLRSELMRAAERELMGKPFRVGEGQWQYNATLQSWRELKFLGFDTGSGLENKDEVLDALEVARKEAQEERDRVAEVRRQREIAKQKRLEEERRRREEEERLRWMRETEERRRLVQEHMANLKRQRALEAERGRMAREEALTLGLMREEKRLLQVRHVKEAAAVEKRRIRDLAAAADAAAAAEIQHRQDAEVAAMTFEDARSREVEDESRLAEAALRERAAYLRELYTSFIPLWAGMEHTVSQELEGAPGEGGGKMGRPTVWWKGADAPQIWAGPSVPYPRVPRLRPGSRFVPHARAVLDGLEPQAMSVGKLSREYLALLGLPHESIRGMYEQGMFAVNNGDAMVDGIQLGRVFTMFEKDEVRTHLVPVVPLERLGTRHSSRGRASHALERRRRPQTVASGERHPGRSSRQHRLRGLPSPTMEDGGQLLEPTRSSARTAGSLRRGGSDINRRGNASGGGRDGSGGWPGEGWGRRVVRDGAEAIAGFPLSGDERDDVAKTFTQRMANPQECRGRKEIQPRIDDGLRQLGQWSQSDPGVKFPLTVIVTPSSTVRSGVTEKCEMSPRVATLSPSASPGGATNLPTPLDGPPQQPHKQWGGFGPGHVPRFFRGKFGVAGEKKRLIGRKGRDGGIVRDKIVLENVGTVRGRIVGCPADRILEDVANEGSIASGVVDGGSSSTTSLAEPSTVGGMWPLLSPPSHESIAVLSACHSGGFLER